ncbi:MAG: hypothetical protein OXE50_15980 [Chloroflexi bacterium]|nr:hypothetical protein [Chloroflexota bacterium]
METQKEKAMVNREVREQLASGDASTAGMQMLNSLLRDKFDQPWDWKFRRKRYEKFHSFMNKPTTIREKGRKPKVIKYDQVPDPRGF